MLGNQNNPDGNRLRLYGQNERASSSSSGPKWTSSITDLLVNRSNTMRFNQPQSHQTSQQQLLAQTHSQHQSQPTSMHNLHSGVGAPSSKGPQNSEGGRLMMKLMNLGAQQQIMGNPHHQPTSSNMSGLGIGVAPSSSTFDHPRLSGSRDDQKRLALDECTNYLQQKNVQQHFPSTSMAISNIINSNRSANSAGIPGGAPSSTQASAAAKKFQAFKFNLTMNKQKALSGAGPTTDGPSYSSNAFYQAQMQNEQQIFDGAANEDMEAMLISDKQKKQMTNMSRGSSQLAMKQHLKQMIKSYEDQPQVPGHVGHESGLQYNETQQIPSSTTQDNQHLLTYDHSVRKGSAALPGAGGTLQPASAKYTGSASSSSKNKPLDRKVHEMEERQKIFEEEIIKRVKEIQSYAKTLHMHLKKIQQTSNKRNEDLQLLKEELVQQIKDCHDLAASANSHAKQSHSADSTLHELMEKRLKLQDSEFSLQLEHLEQKLTKDFDGKLARQARASANEQQLKGDTLRDEILALLAGEYASNMKSEIMRGVAEKVKDLAKINDKSVNEIRELVLEKAQQIEDLSTDSSTFQKELTSKHDKLTKTLRDLQTHTDTQLAALGETLRVEVDQVKKKIGAEIKAEVQSITRNYITQEDMNQELEQFQRKVERLEAQLQEHGQHKPQTSSVDSQVINQRFNELQSTLEDQLSHLANELNSSQLQTTASHDALVRQTQDTCLQLKSQLSSANHALEDKLQSLTLKLDELDSSLSDVQSALERDQKPVVGKEDLVEAVMELVQPEIDNLNDVSRQLGEQAESQRQQLQSRVTRTELQEIKHDIDLEIQSLHKVIKRVEERVGGCEGSSHEVDGLQAQVSQIGGDIDGLEQQISQLKQTTDGKLQHLSHDLQSKTEDLYAELKELQEQLASNQPATPRSESTPERKSRLEAMASLRTSLEASLSELQTKVTDLEGSLQALQESQLTLEQVQQTLGKGLVSLSADLHKDFDTKLIQPVADLRAHIDEMLDEAHTKLNQHDARLSTLEEKQFESPDKNTKIATAVEEQVDYQSQIEDLHAQFVDLKVMVEEAVQDLEDVEKRQGEFQKELEQMRSQADSQRAAVKEEIEQLAAEVATQRELNACLQDVAVTQEEYQNHKASMGDTLKEIEDKNKALEKEIKELRDIISTLQEQPKEQVNTVNQELVNQVAAIEERLTNLEQQPKQVVQVVTQQQNYLSNPVQVTSPILQQQRKTTHHEQSAKVEGVNAGHFLEELSEVISSPNNYGNQTQGQDDMLLFNNRSQQSIGRNSILSNRLAAGGNLISPIGDRSQQFQFNSQLAGQKLNLDNHEEGVPKSASSQREESKASEYGEDKQDEGGFETESPQKDMHAASQEDEEEEEEAAPMQEINISLESAKEEEEAPIQQQHVRSTPSTGAKRVATSSLKTSPNVVDVESQENNADEMGNRNVEEVLENLRDAEEDEMFERQEIESQEIMEDGQDQDVEDNQTPAQIIEGNQDDEEALAVNLMSPASQIQHNNVGTVPNHHHTAPQHTHQANHFVAFESDEEDSQQYDLLPINNQNSRNAPGPHGSSQGPQSVAAPVRNRYYESGSGEEEVDQPLVNPDEVEADAEEIDNFHVEFRDRPDRPQSQADQHALERLQTSSPIANDQEEQKDAEFDDSPMDAASSQRFDQRFEDEGDVRRPITSLARNLREQEQENQDDPDFQAIQHETLSSHRSSELSDRQQANNSRRSISPNLEHEHNNIDQEDVEEEEEKEPEVENLEGTQEFSQDDQQPAIQQTSVIENFPAEESKIQVDEENHEVNSEEEEAQQEEEAPLSQRVEEPKQKDDQDDDWNLDDVTASQRIENLEYDQEEEEKEASQDGPSIDNQLRSDQVANWIVEHELNTCIQALYQLRNRQLQQHDQITPIKGGDLLNIEDSSEWY